MASTSAIFSTDPQSIFDDIDRQFNLSDANLLDITKAFLAEFKVGLSEYGHPMAMIPSFVTGVPDGTETGTFLALDLGGTNLRVCEVVLKGDKTFNLRQQKYKVSDALKTGEATTLFDYLADSVDAFLTSHPSHEEVNEPFGTRSDDVVHLGLTFSFPVEQTALGSGKILTWTKGFSAKHAVGNDVVQLLQDAFNRKHMHVSCVALVNEQSARYCLERTPVGYLVGGCLLGAIFGTGTNGAYIEDVANITKLGKDSPAVAKGGEMIINCEWGAFNNSRSHLPTSAFDNTLDRLSINPRFQAFEKRISGMFIGEVTRLILTSFIDAAPSALVFGGEATKAVSTQWGIDTSIMSAVEEAWDGRDSRAKAAADVVPRFDVFDEAKLTAGVRARLERVRKAVVLGLGYPDTSVTLKDAAIVRWTCGLVARRAAVLSGVAVAAVLIQTNRATFVGASVSPNDPPKKDAGKPIIVGVDGSLIEHYPGFEGILRESLRFLVGEEVEGRVDIGLAKDGSGVGAALCALQAIKQLHHPNATKA